MIRNAFHKFKSSSGLKDLKMGKKTPQTIPCSGLPQARKSDENIEKVVRLSKKIIVMV